MKASIHLRLGNGLNGREHWRARAARVKAERLATWAVLRLTTPPALPCTIVIARVAPSNGLDDDNLAGACKGVRDQAAEWLGLDDRDPRVKWRYTQRRGPWGVEIESRTPMEELTRLTQELGIGL